jgi:hypothetical protein
MNYQFGTTALMQICRLYLTIFKVYYVTKPSLIFVTLSDQYKDDLLVFIFIGRDVNILIYIPILFSLMSLLSALILKITNTH